MPIWALLGLVGVGGYVLLSSKTASAASAQNQPPSLAQQSAQYLATQQQLLATNQAQMAQLSQAQQNLSTVPLPTPTDPGIDWPIPGVNVDPNTGAPLSATTQTSGTVGSGYWTPKLLADLAQLRASLPPGWTVDPWHNRLVFHGPFGESHYAVTWNEARRYAHHIQTEGKTRFVDPMSGAAY